MKQSVKILIIEDSEGDAELALRALRHGGFDLTHRRIQTAAELESALVQERWDAVISEIMMPGFTGIEALGICRATCLDLPFILVSGKLGEEYAVDAVTAGASAYVMKNNLVRLAPALARELKDAAMRDKHLQAQRDLLYSERRLRAIVEAEPGCVKVVSQNGVLLEMNAAGLAMLEADSLAAVQSRPLIDFIAPEYRAAFADLHKRVIRGESGMLEFEVIGLKGGRRWLETHASPLDSANGSGPMLLGISRDITERKVATEDLRRSENLKDAILEASLDCAVTINHEGKIVEFNAAAQRTFGISREQALGKLMVDLMVPPRLRDAHRKGFDHYLATGHGPIIGKRLNLEAIRADGTEFPIELTVAAISTTPPMFTGFIRDISERKRAELSQRQLADNLEIERSRLVAAQQVAKIGSWETDPATMSVLWSDETHRIHETDPATFRPTHSRFLELVHPEDRARVNDAFQQSLAQGTAFNRIEHRLLLADGRIKFIEERWQVHFDKQKKPVRSVGTCQDITERKRTEMASIRLAAIVESSEDAIVSKDLNSIVTSWNRGAEKIFGYTADEMVGTSILRLFPMDRQEEEKYIMGKINRGERVEHFDTLRQTKDGRLIDVSVTISPIKDATGKVIGVSKLARDITERKLAERRLQSSEAKFRHLIEQAADGMVTSDALGNFVMVNSRACELLGYTEEEMLGMNGIATYPDEERELHAKRMQAVGAGKTLRFERMFKRKDGSTFPAEVSAKKLDDGTVQAIFHDITQRRAQEQKIARLSRIYAVVSGIRSAIVRIRGRHDLFQEACRIIVEHGRFSLGWIAMLDPETGKLTAAAQAGLTENSGSGNVLNHSASFRPVGTAEVALREQRPAFDNAIEVAPGADDPGAEPNTMAVRRAAMELGAQSVIVLPLIVDGATFGILTLYAREQNFFDDEEVKLLTELADDISFGLEFIAKNEKVNYLAYYDVLTGLANRSLFLERVSQYMRIAVSTGHKLALYLIDLERFKNINDSLGQKAGDMLLRQVAEWLTRNAGEAMLVARVGADHFAVVLPDVNQTSDVARVMEATMESLLDHPFHLMGSIFRVAAKAGIALFPEDGADAATLYRHAEAALKKAKANGERYLFYTQQMTEMVAVKLTLENQLRQAIDHNEFVLHYQPKVNLVSGKLAGAEALIRWNDPRTGLVAPGRFIPILEETGMIYDVGRWALRKAIEDYLRWQSAGLPALRVAVNVSPLQLRSRGFVAEISEAIGIDARAVAGLELEITESLIMEDIKHNITTLQGVRALGATIAIDDFGTGFSSLSYLSRLPVDTLKIDRSFVDDMTTGPEGLALVSTIISLAHSLKLNVVAEGVETDEQSRLLRLLNCDEMQGYLFSKPVPTDIFESRFLAPV